MDEELMEKRRNIDDRDEVLALNRYNNLALEGQRVTIRDSYTVECSHVDNNPALINTIDHMLYDKYRVHKRHRFRDPVHTPLPIEQVIYLIEELIVSAAKRVAMVVKLIVLPAVYQRDLYLQLYRYINCASISPEVRILVDKGLEATSKCLIRCIDVYAIGCNDLHRVARLLDTEGRMHIAKVRRTRLLRDGWG